jgi:NADP-dependent 3-hydroxy acid dehydrogenase YdfG
MTSTPVSTVPHPLKREPESLRDKVVFLTGASKGLGLALSEALCAEGARVMRVSRSLPDAILSPTEQTAALDVSDAAAVKRAVEKTLETWGRIDIVINNAAICGPFQLFQEHSPEAISEHIDINLKGPMYVMQAVLPSMVTQGGGDIITINSVAGKQIYAYCSVYGATKFGLDAVCRTIAEEQRSNNIRVMNFYPGRIDTPIWDSIEPNTPQNPHEMLSVYEVTEAILFALKQPRAIEIREMTLAPTHCD